MSAKEKMVAFNSETSYRCISGMRNKNPYMLAVAKVFDFRNTPSSSFQSGLMDDRVAGEGIEGERNLTGHAF